MSSVDNRIVNMKFDNASFEKGVATTISTLTKLTDKLKLTGASKGLDDVQSKASRFNLNGMDGAVTGISKKFLALSTIAITALSNITNRAVNAGLNFAKSFTVGPILDGLHEYQTNLQSIQTIQANTDQPLTKIQKSLDELNKYSDATIYNFSEMARNIGTFTAAGVGLKDATSSIKGIANMAALSGSSSMQASSAMYQLSQAIAAGKVGAQDWNSVVNAGMAGKKLQNALAQTAVAMGKIDQSMISGTKSGQALKISGESFKNSIMSTGGKTSWLTSDVLVKTLATLDGRFSRAALSTEKLADGTLKYKKASEVTAVIEKNRAELAKQGVKFSDAQFKSLSKLSDASFKSATQVKTLGQVFDVAKETIGSGWSSSFKSLFGNLNESKALFTGMSNTINDFINANALARNNLLAAWKQGGGRVAVIDGIKAGFQALFAVLKPIQQAFRDIFPATTAKQLIDYSNRFRDFMQSLKIGSDTADKLRSTFRGVFAILDIGVQIIKGILTGIGELFSTVGKGSGSFLNLTGSIGDFLVSLDQSIKKSGVLIAFFKGLGQVLSLPLKLLGAVAGALSNLFGNFDISGIASKVANAFHAVTDAITGAFTTDNVNSSMSIFTAGLTGGIFLILKQFIGRITTLFNGGIFGGGGMLDSIKNTFQTLTGSLKAMQTQIQAKTLLLIAGALALLTASVVALSFIDAKALSKSMGALAAGFGELLAAMAVLVKISGSAGFIKVPLIAASMVLLSAAILLLTAAVAAMSRLSWESIGKGLAGIAGALVAVAAGMRLMPKGMVAQAAALTLLGVALNAIALAVAGLGLLSWEAIAKGLVAITGALLGIAGAMHLMPKGMILQAAGLVLIAAALDVMAAAIAGLGQLSWEAIGKGLVSIAGALLIIAGAMQLMPATLPITAAGLILVGIALNAIGLAVIGMAQLGWEQIAKGLTALAGAMAILAIGLNLMGGTLLGSAALLAASAALAILTPVLLALGTMSWEAIGKGLAVLAASLLLLAGAGLLLAPAALGLIGMGAAIALFGVGLAAAGAGTLAFATALKLLGPAATGAANTIGLVLKAIIGTIPAALKAFGEGIVAFAGAIAKGAPQFARAFMAVLTSILNTIVTMTPKIVRTLNVMLDALLGLLVRNIPKIVNAGMQLILGLLRGIRSHIDEIVRVAGDIIVKFINGVAKQQGRIIDAGVRLIISFINGVSRAISAHSGELGAAGGRLGVAVVQGMAKGILGGLGAIAGAALSVAKSALNAAKGFLGIHSPSRVFRDLVGKPIAWGWAQGINEGSKDVSNAAVNASRNALNAVRKQGIPDEFKKLGKDLNQGFVKGLVADRETVKGTLSNLNDDLKSALEDTQKTVQADKDKLDKLLKAKKQDADAINKARAALAQAENLNKLADAAHTKFTKNLADEKKNLLDLAKQYEDLTKKIDDATKARDDAVAARDNANTSITSQYDGMPDITADTTVADYTNAVASQAQQTAAFLSSLNALANMGLDDATYQKLLDQGLGAQPFIDQLIAAGPNAVEAINKATTDLTKASKDLGNTASTHLYQAGVDAAEGLLKGLKTQNAAIVKQMTDLANLIDNTIRKALKIKSPSRVMMEIGRYTSEGLAQGITQYASSVDKSANDVAQRAIAALSQSMTAVQDKLGSTGDLNPVIAPVLDLTQLQKDASQIGSMINAKPISAALSYGQAASISTAQKSAPDTSTDISKTSVAPVIKFEQTNISPKALSPVEIYRNTRNQLSLAKEALTNS